MSFENPYQTPLAAVADSPSDGVLEAADRGTRLVAVIVDTLIYASLGIVAAIAVPALLSTRRGGEENLFVGFAFLGLMAFGILAIFIWNLVWLHKYGQTIGKRVMNVRIVRNDASRADLGRIFFLRMLVPGLLGAIPIIGGIFGLVNVCFIFRDDRRCIHDLLADTVVVKA